MSERDHVAAFCEQLGASRAQAQTMAAQLLKRAEQLAAARGSTREAELARLLQLVAQGRAGNAPAEFSPPRDLPNDKSNAPPNSV